jgi:hypothetical protein
LLSTRDNVPQILLLIKEEEEEEDTHGERVSDSLERTNERTFKKDDDAAGEFSLSCCCEISFLIMKRI